MCKRCGHDYETTARRYWGGLPLGQKIQMIEAMARDSRPTTGETLAKFTAVAEARRERLDSWETRLS